MKLGKIGSTNMMHHSITAKSYVQDGLIAMWDGIENAGWGVHDAAATTWKDLVGKLDFSISANDATWIDDALSVPYKDRYDVAKTNDRAAFATIEIVGNFISGSRIIFIEQGSNAKYAVIIQYSMQAVQGTNGVTGLFAWGNIGKKSSMTIVYNSSKTMTAAFVEGVPVSLSSGNNAWGNVNSGNSFSLGARIVQHGNFGGSFNNIRLYSRALTAKEITENYIVDKARFNLPGGGGL